ncbi:MAG: hypothetical protein IJB73_06325 [Firmicutes bacterium]|nr:hypothetical protein [Bacillota bacterium]
MKEQCPRTCLFCHLQNLQPSEAVPQED